MPRARCLRASQRGFTLLEVLVAMMILAMSLGAILQQFALASRAGSAATDATRATVYAREKIEELKMQREPSESIEHGSFDDGFKWETSVQFYEYDEIEDESIFEDMQYETYLLSAVVSWQYGNRSKQVELVTLKTVPKKEWD